MAPVIELIDVAFGFGERCVLDGLHLQIAPGQTTVIVGQSGSGKSVLLKLMLGLLAPQRGRVLAFGRDLAALSGVELLEVRKRIGMVFQGYALFDALSVAENVGFGLTQHTQLGAAEIARRIGALLDELGLGAVPNSSSRSPDDFDRLRDRFSSRLSSDRVRDQS